MQLENMQNLTDKEFIKEAQAHPCFYDHSPAALLMKEALARLEHNTYAARGDQRLPSA